jgi:hypothetical protein
MRVEERLARMEDLLQDGILPVLAVDHDKSVPGG